MRTDTTPNCYRPGQADLDAETEAKIERRQRVLGPAYRLSYANPLHFVRGEGVWLFDDEGDAYLDFYNNVVSLGHCHPRIVEAMTRQASALCTNTRYLHDTIITYAERLTALFPEPLSQAMFACTGSEANDLACRIAKFQTGGEGFIITDFAYHGTTSLIASLSANLGPNMPLGPTVRTVPAPAPARTSHATSGDVADVARGFTQNVQSAIDDLRRHGIKPAALLVDSLFSSDGVYPDPPGFLAGAVDAIRNAGGLFIADEVQPGFGRTGEAMWGFERHGVVPDIVTLGKPMGNGYPMSGVVLRPEIVEGFGACARYFNTFGGNTVAAANGLAVLDVIKDDDILSNVQSVGRYLGEALRSISDDHFGQVRGAGLFFGVDIVENRDTMTPDPARAARIVNTMRDRNVLISLTGKDESVLKIRPPLVTSKSHVDQFIETLTAVIAEV
ncbi:MAG: aspartate aminotransferase family protein [Pseudomonadota bacterium]